MIRIIAFLILIAGLALAGAWLADRPGDIVVNWMGWRIETSLLVAAGVVAALVVLVMALWSLVRFVLRSPRILAHIRRERRRRRGERAVSRGLVAVASGDMRNARKFAGEADRFAGDDPLALLLSAQTAQLSGDRARADTAFRAMAERPETRLLGLRGLYIEAQRRGDTDAVRRHAEEAVRSAPALPWAAHAAFELRCSSGDWAGALTALDGNMRSRLIDRTVYRRQRAVLLTARALDAQATDPAGAKALAQEAAKLAPDLVPAVSLAARLAAESGEQRRAGKLVEAAWQRNPHPDLAEIYAHLRSGDSARERLARVQNLARLRPGDRESALALARAALDAQEFAIARGALAPLTTQPTQRVAMLMAELEETEHGDAGRAREWMGRALRAGGDPRWTADGMVSDRWWPVSPVSGRVDAFEWKVPLAELGYGPTIAAKELDTPTPLDALPAPTPVVAASEPERPENSTADPAAVPVPSAAAEPEARRSGPMRAALDGRMEPPASNAGRAPVSPSVPRREAVIPLMHAPDDPGPDHDADPAGIGPQRFPAR
jgi:HemY protein